MRPRTRHRRYYLPPQWFQFVDLLRTLAERGSAHPDDVRWFFYLT